MERLRKLSRRAAAFVAGDYPGAPVDYAMALVLVLATAGVLLVGR